MISYVILVSIVIAISIGVFVWLKDVANVEPPINCKEGTSIILAEITCSSSGIDLNLKNNGRFSIDGIILTISNESELTNPTYLVPGSHVQGESAGSSFFEDKLKPSENTVINYTTQTRKFVGGATGQTGFGNKSDVTFLNVKSIQIQPVIYGDKGGLTVCQDALIRQEISGCSFTDALNPLDLQGLVGWWKFEGNADDSFSDHHGTVNGGEFIAGDFGQALKFNGVDDYVDFGDKTNFEPQNLTISALVEIYGNGSGGNVNHILSKQNDSTGYRFFYNKFAKKFTITVWNSTGDPNAQVSSVINEDEWYHAVATYDNSEIKIFINGVEDKTKLVPGGISYNPASSVPLLAGKAGAGNWNYLNGSIDEIMLFNQALSQENITALYEYYQ